jgi:hypothetical protein
LLSLLLHLSALLLKKEHTIGWHHRVYSTLVDAFSKRDGVFAKRTHPLISPRSPSALDDVFIRHRTRMRGAGLLGLRTWRESDAAGRQ